MELEPNGDELDLSYPETGPRVLIGTMSEERRDSDADEDGDRGEPGLGSLDGQADQNRWAAGGRRDFEVDGAESGIGDLDGLLEQIGAQDWQGPRGGKI